MKKIARILMFAATLVFVAGTAEALRATPSEPTTRSHVKRSGSGGHKHHRRHHRRHHHA
jgi:hypothetical protein